MRPLALVVQDTLKRLRLPHAGLGTARTSHPTSAGREDWIRHAKPFPLAAALLDKLVHGATSAVTTLSTASTASRAARHSETPAESARSPASVRASRKAAGRRLAVSAARTRVPDHVREEFERWLLALVREYLSGADEPYPEGYEVDHFLVLYQLRLAPLPGEDLTVWDGGAHPGWRHGMASSSTTRDYWHEEVLLTEALEPSAAESRRANLLRAP